MQHMRLRYAQASRAAIGDISPRPDQGHYGLFMRYRLSMIGESDMKLRPKPSKIGPDTWVEAQYNTLGL